ncbi:MAG: hypothetical protein RBS39_13565 [Phycisphaerales bacterium]|jgi:hypothetical protein|nr:hypothetical protein [Phycisphaerales bacterium]
MASGREFTAGQRKIIDRYYANLDTIQLTRLQELVSEVYLAAADAAGGAPSKKADALWKRALDTLAKVGVPASRLDALRASRDPKALASIVADLQKK